MYARVARFQGGSAEGLRAAGEEIASRVATGPPEGVPSVGFTLLIDPNGGQSLAIGLFETEADLKAGDAVLNEMSPPGEGMGTRGAVEVYEVAVDMRTGA